MEVSNTSTALLGLKPIKKTRILVVDDEKTNVDLLSRYLTQQGYDVDSAFNGQEALQKVHETTPDLILLDIVMPVLDGLGVCQQLRADISTHSLPIILLTARDALEDRIKGLSAGVDDYIVKPFDLGEVKARLKGALERRRWDLGSNPLTHLPGNTAIEEEIYKRLRIGSPFAFAYIDIDHFKAYNDVYGFQAGDKVLKHVANLLIDVSGNPSESCAFAGHVGGDDFVFLSTIEHMRGAISEMAGRFDAQRERYYHRHDLERERIQSKDRQGQVRDFPLMTLSVAIVSTTTRRILHHARLVEIANELKHFTKAQDHKGRSLIMWDRRADEYTPPVDGKPV